VSESDPSDDATGDVRVPAREAGGVLQDPWLRFALTFGALAVLTEVVYYGLALESDLFEAYLAFLARTSGWILSHFTENVRVSGAVISGSLFSVEIAQGCDAYRISALLCSAILAFPAHLSTKLWGLVLGLIWLNSLNYVRIVGLYFIGGYYREQFQASHEIYFPVFLICMTVLAWILWVRRATRDFEPDPEPDPA
jgi:exosortase H (IPTLxxWG-CTERM-specific)